MLKEHINSISKNIFLSFFKYFESLKYVCICVWVCAHGSRCWWKPEESVWAPGVPGFFVSYLTGLRGAEPWKSSVFRACLSPTEHGFVNCAWVLPRAPGDFRRAILCGLPALGGFPGSSGIFNSLAEKTARDAIFILCQHELPNRIETLVSPTCLIHVSLSVTSASLSHWDREDSSSLSSGEGALPGFLRVDKSGNQRVSAEADLRMLSRLIGYVEVQLWRFPYLARVNF